MEVSLDGENKKKGLPRSQSPAPKEGLQSRIARTCIDERLAFDVT